MLITANANGGDRHAMCDRMAARRAALRGLSRHFRKPVAVSLKHQLSSFPFSLSSLVRCSAAQPLPQRAITTERAFSSADSSCPISYRYSPSSLSAAQCRDIKLEHRTVYVIGGLYGNYAALQYILQLAAQDPSGPVTLIFNGDFNFFNADTASFQAINDIVLNGGKHHIATRGNIETEISNDTFRNCGCAYPEWVDSGVVSRSDAITQRLFTTAHLPQFASTITPRLAALPRFFTFRFAGSSDRIAVVHGDVHSLSGWEFSVETLRQSLGKSRTTANSTSCAAAVVNGGGADDADRAVRSADDSRASAAPTVAQLSSYFDRAGVCAFLCTHTCLPVAATVPLPNSHNVSRSASSAETDVGVIFNNGAAGMANFEDTTYGLITRVSIDPRPPQGR